MFYEKYSVLEDINCKKYLYEKFRKNICAYENIRIALLFNTAGEQKPPFFRTIITKIFVYKNATMKIPYLNIVLLLTNLCILFFITTGQKNTDKTSDIIPVLRAQLIELVDAKGQVRAQLKVEDNSEAVFRMKDAQGTIRVKLGAGADCSGLVLLDSYMPMC